MSTTITTEALIGLSLVAYFASVVASLAGIGGGQILVPLYSIIANLQSRQAVILSTTTIIGSSFVRAVYFFTKRHKHAKNRYLVNYSLVRIIVPFNGNMAYIGLLLNQNLPTIAIFIIFTIILFLLTFKSFDKMLSYWWEILKRKKKKDKLHVNIDGIDIELGIVGQDHTYGTGEHLVDIVVNMIYALLSLGFITFFTFMRNFTDMPWLIYLIQFVLITGFGYVTIRDVVLLYEARKYTDFNFIKGDINWSSKTVILKMILMASIVGLIGTMVGIGGGAITNPVLIGIGVSPNIVAATGSILTFFSSLISTIQFLAAGEFVEWFLVILAVAGGFGGITAMIINKIFHKKIDLIVTTSITFVLITSFILFVAFNIIDMNQHGII